MVHGSAKCLTIKFQFVNISHKYLQARSLTAVVKKTGHKCTRLGVGWWILAWAEFGKNMSHAKVYQRSHVLNENNKIFFTVLACSESIKYTLKTLKSIEMYQVPCRRPKKPLGKLF